MIRYSSASSIFILSLWINTVPLPCASTWLLSMILLHAQAIQSIPDFQNVFDSLLHRSGRCLFCSFWFLSSFFWLVQVHVFAWLSNIRWALIIRKSNSDFWWPSWREREREWASGSSVNSELELYCGYELLTLLWIWFGFLFYGNGIRWWETASEKGVRLFVLFVSRVFMGFSLSLSLTIFSLCLASERFLFVCLVPDSWFVNFFWCKSVQFVLLFVSWAIFHLFIVSIVHWVVL